jgi:phosphate transport system substrate-binding protein
LSLDAEQAPAPLRSGAGRRALARITLTAAVLAVAACSNPAPAPSGLPPAAASAAAVTLPTAPAAGAQTLSETGSSLMAPLFALWGPAYHARFSQVALRTTSSSSGQGIDAAAASTADIGASDAYLSPATLAKHAHLVNIPLAVAALMVVYHVPGIGPGTHVKLDGKLLARIYAGQITQWDDPAIAAANPGVKLPSAGIVLVHRGDDSGSTFLFTSYLNAQDPSGWSGALIGTTIAWPRQPGELSASGTEDMISEVGSTAGAIGYVGVSYLSQVRAAGEGEAALGNSAGDYLLPAAGTIKAALASFTNTPASETISLVNGAGAQAYPIVNYEYAIVNTAQRSATRARDLRAFLSWAITSGAAQVARVNFQPLPSSVVTLSGTQIATIKG